MDELHAIAARLDRLPRHSKWHSHLVLMLGAAVFCDCLVQYVGSSMLTSLVSVGWSTFDLNVLSISLTMVGYSIGSLIGGCFSDKYGRRKGILCSVLTFVVFAFVAALAQNMEWLIVCRFVMGIGLGAALVVSYGSLPEYSPAQARGYYSGIVGLIGNFSPPLGFLATLVVLPLVGWRVLYVFLGLISLGVLFVLYKRFPESPRWLASQGNMEEADNFISEIETDFRSQGVNLKTIEEAKIKYNEKIFLRTRPSFRDLFKAKLRKRTFCACCLLFAMNALVYTFTNWTSARLVLQGINMEVSLGATTSILLGAPFGILFLVVFADKHSRKGGLIVCLLVLAALSIVWSNIPQDDMAAVILIGFALCAWLYYYSLLACSVYVGELFPTQIRLRGVGFANAIGRFASVSSPFLVSGTVSSWGMSMVYIICALICLITAVILFFFGTETRYRTLEDISDA